MYKETPDKLFLEALTNHMGGDWQLARFKYEKILEEYPAHADTLHHLGLLFLQIGKLNDAIQWIRRSLASKHSEPRALSNLGYCHYLVGDYKESLSLCIEATRIDPTSDGAWTNLGNAQRALGLSADAQVSYLKALEISPRNPRYLFNLANIYVDQKEIKKAVDLFLQSILIESNIPEVYNNLSSCYLQLDDPSASLAYASKAIQLRPDYPEAWNNRGVALNDLKHLHEALKSYDRAIELQPNYPEAWNNRGTVLCGLRRYDQALMSYERALDLRPDYAEAWTNRGIALSALRRRQEAVECHKRAIQIKPDYADALANLGSVLSDLKLYEEALASYERAIEIKPDTDFLLGSLIHTQMKICDWTNISSRLSKLESELGKGQKCSTPFSVLGLFDSPKLQQVAAQIYSTETYKPTKPDLIARRPQNEKIRLGYFSMDFKEHPVSHLIFELLESHNRNRFELYAFSFGIDTQDTMRKSLERVFDRFLDVQQYSDIDITRLSRELEIDIAIDLGGHTKDARPQIFVDRAAPIQINYLGYPGTWGDRCMDYFIGDRVAVTDANCHYFSEKVVFLPNQFQANPRTRPIAKIQRTKLDYGLPQDSFVFCCFNNNWKILPSTFQGWMRILQQVPNSVLWLYAENPQAPKNLRKEAESFGVSQDRLVFFGKLSREAYMAQYLQADLFLDTLPYNAGTTASDALWAGLPVLTLAGQAFAGRMAASLLNAIGLPELIAKTPEHYEALAIELATNPQKITLLRKKLQHNMSTTPLFDIALFTKHIESAYETMYQRYQAGLQPDHIYIDEQA